MHIHIKARCERVRANNGITEVLFTRQADMANNQQEEHVLINVRIDDKPIEGQFYWVLIQPDRKLTALEGTKP